MLIDLMNMSILNVWVNHLPQFAQSIRLNYWSFWEEEDEATPDAENVGKNEGSFNVCGLMDVSVFEITRFGFGPADEGPNKPRRPNACAK